MSCNKLISSNMRSIWVLLNKSFLGEKREAPSKHDANNGKVSL